MWKEEIPEKNPNVPNDIYKKDGGTGADFATAMLILLSIGMIAVAVFGVTVFIRVGKIFVAVIFLAFGLFGGVKMLYCHLMSLYLKYPYRKKIIANGTPYVGIITKVFPYTRRIGAGAAGVHLDLETYCMEVKYADKSIRLNELDGSPEKYLENPYCTVYVWKGKAVAADFKVRNEYIAKSGKTYSLKPVKKV